LNNNVVSSLPYIIIQIWKRPCRFIFSS